LREVRVTGRVAPGHLEKRAGALRRERHRGALPSV
jgi:hypothetical protein